MPAVARSCTAPAGIGIGTAVSGSFSLNPAFAGAEDNAHPAQGSYLLTGGSSSSLTVGAYQYAGFADANGGMRVEVFDASFVIDRLRVITGSLGVQNFSSFPLLGDYGLCSFSFSDATAPYDLLTGDGFPQSSADIDTDAITAAAGAIENYTLSSGGHPIEIYRINFALTGLVLKTQADKAVPEPATALLLVTALAGLGRFRRQRRLRRA